MKQLSASCLCPLIVLSLVCFFSGSSALAQNTKQPDDNRTIQSLLNEVRLLRQTLQRTGLNAHRSQIILDRLRARNEKVERLSRALEDVRNEIEKTTRTIPRMSEQIKLMETMIEQQADATQRARLEFEHKDLKEMIEQYKSRLEVLREREIQLSTQLRAEQTIAVELESRLDALEREIEHEIARQRAEDKATDGNKQH